MSDIQTLILAITLAIISLSSLGVIVYFFLQQGRRDREHLSLWVKAQEALFSHQAEVYRDSLQTLKATSAIEAANASKIREQTKVELELHKDMFHADLKRQEALQEKLDKERAIENTVYDTQGRKFDFSELEPVADMGE